MMPLSWIRGWLALASLVVLIAAASAQPLPLPTHRYIEFKIDPEYEAKLKERLHLESQLGPLKELVNQVLADPSKMPSDPSQLKGINLKDQAFREALKEWVKRDPELRKALEQWSAKKVGAKSEKDLGTLQNDLKKLLDDTPKADPPPPVPTPRLDIVPSEPETKPAVSLALMTEQAMKEAEKGRLGDWLRDSPAWNRAMTDLRASFGDPNAARFQMDDWQQKVLQKDGTLWKFGESTLDQIRAIPRPPVSVPGIDGLGVPGVGGPGMPELGGTTMPMIGTIATWTLFLGVVVAALWQLVRWVKPRSRIAAAAAQTGPWPVRPEAIATPSELVLAFDHLALLTLGPEAHSWNHHAVALQWRDQAPALAASTAALEKIYEQARYANDDAGLTDADREKARRALLQLVESL